MGYGRRGAIAALLVAGSCSLAEAAGPPGPLKDWPCSAPFADRLTPEGVWPTTLPAPLPVDEAWTTDAQARQLVEFIVDPANSPQSGVQHIEDFVHGNGPLR